MKILEIKGEIVYQDIFESLRSFLKEHSNCTTKCLVVIEYSIKIKSLIPGIHPIKFKIIAKDKKNLQKAEKTILNNFKMISFEKTDKNTEGQKWSY